MEKLIITVAPCAPPTYFDDIPGLRLTPEVVAEEVYRAYNAGASLAHLHVLDEQGYPTDDLTAFCRTLELIRERCDIILEGSTGGVGTLSAAERSVSLQTNIELASLNPGSVNYDADVYINSPQDIDYWVKTMHARGIKPDIAIFETGMIANAMRYAAEGLIEEPYLFSFVLGQAGAMPATAKNLLHLAESIPPGSIWGVLGHGGYDLWASSMAILMGGQARAGFEDNLYYRPGELAKSNAQLVERLVRIAQEVGRDIASPGEARQVLGLAGTHDPPAL
ncbi:MAG: 3-keto-5-aminohexanoate cleavage protein [Anaerolineae bacterium]